MTNDGMDRYWCLEDMCNIQDCEEWLMCKNAYDRGKAAGYADRRMEELEHDKKYRWHDLRKNPEDLPEEKINDIRTYFECMHENHINDPFYPCYQFCDGEWGNWEDRFNPVSLGFEDTDFIAIPESYENIIAWREIEPFEGEAK